MQPQSLQCEQEPPFPGSQVIAVVVAGRVEADWAWFGSARLLVEQPVARTVEQLGSDAVRKSFSSKLFLTGFEVVLEYP